MHIVNIYVFYFIFVEVVCLTDTSTTIQFLRVISEGAVLLVITTYS
jgi:hypothetical protein